MGVNTISEARRVIDAFGMTNEAISRAGNLLNSPLAGIVASAFGTDINKARKALNALTGESYKPSSLPSSGNSVDDIERLKAGLKQIQ